MAEVPVRRAWVQSDQVIVILIVITVLCAGWIMVGQNPAAISWLWQTVCDAIFVWLSWRLSQASDTSQLARRFWRAAALGGLVFTLGSLLQTLDAFGGAQTTAASAPLPKILMAIGTGWVAVWLLAHPSDVTGRERVRLWLDAATVMCAAAAFSWSIVLSEPPSTSGQVAATVVGAGIMLVSAFAIVRMVLSGSAPITVAAGLAIGAATTVFGLLGALGQYIDLASNMRIILVARLLPDLLLAVAPRIEQLGSRMRAPTSGPPVRAAHSWLPYMAVAAAQVLLLAQLWYEGLSARTWGTAVGVAIIAALVMLRQNVAMADNAELVAHLDQSMKEAGRLHDQLRHEARHDYLTGLPNRMLLKERAKQLLEVPASPGRNHAMLLMDLDDFKGINDVLGHAIGDQLLIAVGDRLRHCVKPTDTVARLGGDEFAVLMPGAAQIDAVSTAERILGAIAEPVTIEEHSLKVSASIGVVIGADQPFDTLFRLADAAMYKAKQAQSGIHLYISGSAEQKLAAQRL